MKAPELIDHTEWVPMSDASADRRGEILAAAVRVLARDGIAQASTRRIAAEAGINQATLLYHVGSKDELFLAVLREMMRMTRDIALAADPTGGDVRGAIRRCISAFWEHVEAAPELQVLQYELTLYALRNPDAAWLAREQYNGYADVVEGLLCAACAEAGVACALPLVSVARFIVGGLDGLILQFVADRDRERSRRDLEVLIGATIALVEGTVPAAESSPTASAARASS